MLVLFCIFSDKNRRRHTFHKRNSRSTVSRVANYTVFYTFSYIFYIEINKKKKVNKTRKAVTKIGKLKIVYERKKNEKNSTLSETLNL